MTWFLLSQSWVLSLVGRNSTVVRKVRTPVFWLQLENPDKLDVTVRKLQKYRVLPVTNICKRTSAEWILNMSKLRYPIHT